MRFLISAFFLLLCARGANAQQWITSFFQASPLSYNPALTGLMPKDMRVIVNYENENDYNSTIVNSLYASYDMALLKGVMPHKGDALGVGVLYHYVGEDSRYYSLQNSFMGITLAYHKALGKKGHHHLSLGTQTTLSAYTYKYDAIGMPYDEVRSGYRSNYNWGVLYSGIVRKTTSLYGGISRYGYGTSNGSDRYTVLAGMAHSMGEHNTLYGNVSMDVKSLAGGNLKLGLYDKFILNANRPKGKQHPIAAYAGAVFLYDEAVLPYVGVEAEGFRLGLGIDTRTFSNSIQEMGGFQVSLIWTGALPSKRANNWHCTALY